MEGWLTRTVRPVRGVSLDHQLTEATLLLWINIMTEYGFFLRKN